MCAFQREIQGISHINYESNTDVPSPIPEIRICDWPGAVLSPYEGLIALAYAGAGIIARMVQSNRELDDEIIFDHRYGRNSSLDGIWRARIKPYILLINQASRSGHE
jgi:hypothetical protein